MRSLIIAAAILVLTNNVVAQIKQKPQPMKPSEEAIEAATEAFAEFGDNYGPFQVAVVTIASDQGVDATTAELVQTQLASQFRMLDDEDFNLEVDEDGLLPGQLDAVRGFAADEEGAALDAAIAKQAAAPYVLLCKLGPPSRQGRPAGTVQVRLIDSTTGQLLVASTFTYNSTRFKNPNEQVRNNVALWMNQLVLEEDLPKRINSPVRLQVTIRGEVAPADEEGIRNGLVSALELNPNRIRIQGERGLMVLQTRAEEPAFISAPKIMEALVGHFGNMGQAATIDSRSGGDLRVSVYTTPSWYMTTADGRDANPAWMTELATALDRAGGPRIAIVRLSGGNPASVEVRDVATTEFVQAVGRIAAASKGNVPEIVTVDSPKSRQVILRETGGRMDLEALLASAVPAGLTADWVVFIGAAGATERVTAELHDRRERRVLGRATYSQANPPKVPADADLTPIVAAGRQVAGDLLYYALLNNELRNTLQVTIENCPSFEYAQTVAATLQETNETAGAVESLQYNADDRTATFALRYAGSRASELEQMKNRVASITPAVTVVQLQDNKLRLRTTE